MEFLQNTDVKKFQKAQKEAEKVKYSHNLVDIVTLSGQAKVQMSSNAAAFCTKQTDYIDSY